jgi:hypothetical protein
MMKATDLAKDCGYGVDKEPKVLEPTFLIKKRGLDKENLRDIWLDGCEGEGGAEIDSLLPGGRFYSEKGITNEKIDAEWKYHGPAFFTEQQKDCLYDRHGPGWDDESYAGLWVKNEEIKEEEKYHELASMIENRKERIRWVWVWVWVCCRCAVRDCLIYKSDHDPG